MMLARLKTPRSPTGRSLSVWQLPNIIWGMVKFIETTAVVCGVERTAALTASVKILSGAGAVARRKAETAFAENNTEAKLREKGHYVEKDEIVACATDLLAATCDRIDDAADGKAGCLGEAWRLWSALVVVALAGRRVADHAAAAAATLTDALLNPAFDGTFGLKVPGLKSVTGAGGKRPELLDAIEGMLAKMVWPYARLLALTVGHDLGDGPAATLTPDGRALLERLTKAPLCVDVIKLDARAELTGLSALNLLTNKDQLEKLFSDPHWLRRTFKWAAGEVGGHASMAAVPTHAFRKIWMTIHYREWLKGAGCFSNATTLEQFLLRCGKIHNCTPDQLQYYILDEIAQNAAPLAASRQL